MAPDLTEKPARVELFTVGHSNQTWPRFLDLLRQNGIDALADVRRFPSSRSFPHFNRAKLAAALREQGIEYHWLAGLGGRRGPAKTDSPSPNTGLRNSSFRNYADYMLTDEFRRAIDELLSIAASKRTAIMCSEAVFWRCHRRLISDYLLTRGASVQHIFPDGQTRPHALTAGASLRNGRLTYPGQLQLFD